MTGVLKIVKIQDNKETVSTLNELTARAVDGDILGIAFTVICKGGDWEFGVAGECGTSPVSTIGQVFVLGSALTNQLLTGKD